MGDNPHEPETMDVAIEGQRIAAVREMTQYEFDAVGWHETMNGKPVVLVLGNGTKLYASQDSEGNGPGAMFGRTADGTGIFLG